MYRGRIINDPGIIVCPYKKPSLFRRIANWIRKTCRLRKHSSKKPLIVPGSVFADQAKEDTADEKA
jgi:hypothetical protein